MEIGLGGMEPAMFDDLYVGPLPVHVGNAPVPARPAQCQGKRLTHGPICRLSSRTLANELRRIAGKLEAAITMRGNACGA